MEKMAIQRASLAATVVGGALCATLALCSDAAAYTTSSPAVVGMVDRAIPFLEAASDDRPGGMAVIGLALWKSKGAVDHPKIVEAARMIQAFVAASPDPAKMNIDIYSNGLAIIFLVNYDPDTYAREIQALMVSLVAKQKPHGGWGYGNLETGDTSMTQYGVLSTWEAKQVGLEMPPRTVEAVTEWLLRTQDPSGAWGYQGKPSPNDQPVPQEGVRHSMTAAGLGSVYICADLLGLTPEVTPRGESPASALREVTAKQAPAPGVRVQTSIDPGRLRTAQQRGDAWMGDNPRIAQPEHTLYYMYALERYRSFRELAEGKADRDPAKVEGLPWYNAGVDWLLQTRGPDGTWNTGCGKAVDTGFAVLFLLRSTQHSIRRARGFGDGLLIGGRGLPKDGNLISVEGGNVVNKPTLTPFDALRAAMARDDSNAEALAAAAERIDQLAPKESQLLVSEYRKRFRALLSDPAAENRVAAVKMLGRSGDLDNVPMLILALEDREPEVVLAARDGLRRLSRKFDGFGPPDEPSDVDRARAIEKWKAWYLSIRPDAEF